MILLSKIKNNCATEQTGEVTEQTGEVTEQSREVTGQSGVETNLIICTQGSQFESLSADRFSPFS
jgi:hypothetical protein